MSKELFYPLNDRAGWRTAFQSGVTVSRGVQLTAVSDGPLGLNDAADSLGGLLLPRGICTAGDGSIYLLTQSPTWQVKKYNEKSDAFETNEKISAVCAEVANHKWFNNRSAASKDSSNIACVGRLLYVVLNRFVLIFDRHTLQLRQWWRSKKFDPVDVYSDGDVVYLLERQYGRVWKHHPGTDRDRQHDLLIWRKGAAFRWERLGVDQDGNIYLKSARRQLKSQPHSEPERAPKQQFYYQLEDAPAELDIYSTDGRYQQTVHGAGGLKDNFTASPIQIIQDFNAVTNQNISYFTLNEGETYFQQDGDIASIGRADILQKPVFASAGEWISGPLDSEIYRCQWHKLDLLVQALPAGASMQISTTTHETALSTSEVLNRSEAKWSLKLSLSGQLVSQGAQWKQMLIQSQQGRYLWVKIEFNGDGFDSPIVGDVRAHYPRHTYLNDLPAIFSADSESRRFLERYLSIIQSEWDGIEKTLKEYGRYLDPKAVPDGKPLEWLAKWMALPLEGDWNWDQKRNLLTAVSSFYDQRGTLEGLRKYLQVYLQNMSGIEPDQQMGFPQFIEGFQIRKHLVLAEQDTPRFGQSAPLWGPDIVGRIQLDAKRRAGGVRLVSVGQPEDDYFREYAHKFKVFVPAAWVKTKENERMLINALENEKPAHTAYDLCLVEPRFRVGVQSTIGIDSIVGGQPVATLGSAQSGVENPALRPKRHRLGYDMVLGSVPSEKPGPALQTETTVGIDSILR